jgi:hypothetical protein
MHKIYVLEDNKNIITAKLFPQELQRNPHKIISIFIYIIAPYYIMYFYN